MCSVQGEINLLCWRTRSIKIPLKVFHLKNPFSENMSHNWHLWLRNWLWRKKKAQHPIQMPTRCTTLPMSQHKQKTFNTVQIHVHDLSFFSVSWAKYIVPEICGNTCLFYCLLYPAWLVECFFFFFSRQTQVYKCCKFCLCSGVHKGFVKMFMDCGKVL